MKIVATGLLTVLASVGVFASEVGAPIPQTAVTPSLAAVFVDAGASTRWASQSPSDAVEAYATSEEFQLDSAKIHAEVSEKLNRKLEKVFAEHTTMTTR